MAAKRSPAQLRELSAFIETLYKTAGYGTWAEFADDARVHRVSISNWKNGTTGIDGYNLFRLIRAAAAAQVETTPEDLAAAVARALTTAGEESIIVARLDELAGGVAEALRLLREARPEAPGGQQSQGGTP